MDYLQLAQQAFNGSTSYFDANIRKQAEAGLRQFQGQHPAGSKYLQDLYRARSRLFRPKTRATIRKNEAVAAEAMFSTRQVLSIDPEDDNSPLQQAAAALMKPLMQYRLKKSIPWFLVSMGAYQDAQTVGVCISYNYWEYNPKKKLDRPCVELLPIENFRFDPAASWLDPINTSPYCIRMIPMYVKDVRARMRRPEESGKRRWKPLADSQILAAANAYADTTRATREQGRTDSTGQITAVTDFTVVWVHENIMEIDGADFVWFTLSTHGLLTDPVPLAEEYWHGVRPFTLGYSVIQTHKAYPGGVADLTRDVQAEINDLANLRIDNVKFTMSKRYFVKRNKQVDTNSLIRNVPGSATMMDDPEGDVKIVETQDVTGSAYQEQDRLNLDFDDVAGAFSASSVQSNRRLNETVGGMKLLDANTNQVGAYQLMTFVETWVEPTLRQVMLLEAYYEDDQTILKLAGQQAKLVEEFGLDAITDELMQQDLTLTVEVGMGATSPQDRVNNFLRGMEALKQILDGGTLERYGLDVKDVVTEIFSHLGYRDGGRFFDRAEDPNLAAMQAQIEELQRMLEQKVSPEMVAAQVRKLDADTLEKTIRSIFASTQAAQVIGTVPQLAPVADEVLRAGGYKDPGGADPNLPQLTQPAAGLTQDEIVDPRTGVKFTPGVGDTTPLTPASPITGANAGMTTMRPDSV